MAVIEHSSSWFQCEQRLEHVLYVIYVLLHFLHMLCPFVTLSHFGLALFFHISCLHSDWSIVYLEMCFFSISMVA